jgi:hypothetical protein
MISSISLPFHLANPKNRLSEQKNYQNVAAGNHGLNHLKTSTFVNISDILNVLAVIAGNQPTAGKGKHKLVKDVIKIVSPSKKIFSCRVKMIRILNVAHMTNEDVECAKDLEEAVSLLLHIFSLDLTLPRKSNLFKLSVLPLTIDLVYHQVSD